MTIRRRPWGAAAAALLSAALVFSLTGPVGASAAPAAPMPDYPSWDDVQQAKRNQAATAAEVDRIEGLLVALEQQAAELGKQAQLRGEEYEMARAALEEATRKVERLELREREAQDRADESRSRAARLIAQLARTGGGDLTLSLLMGSASQTDQLLSRLSTMNRVSESSSDILARAEFDQNLAEALGDEAEVAETAREGLAEDAEAAFEKAQQASEEAEAEVAAQQAHIDRMYAQLASLKNTTAQIERDYQEGLTEEQENEQNNPPPPPPSNPPPGVDPTPDAPVGSKVSQAIAYAKAQLGEPYAFGGAGPGSWDCSGLTLKSYASAGVSIGAHGASSQYNTMKSAGRLVSINALKAGDLLFYSNGGSTSATKYHVTIYLGGGQMIEAPRPGYSVRIVSVRYGDLVPYAGRPTG